MHLFKDLGIVTVTINGIFYMFKPIKKQFKKLTLETMDKHKNRSLKQRENKNMNLREKRKSPNKNLKIEPVW